MEKERDIVCYQIKIGKNTWERFKACLRKVFWKEGISIDKGIKNLIENFINENEK